MRLLVIHQNFPGQFGHFVRAWSQRPGWDVRGIGRDTAPGLPGFDGLARYKLARNISVEQHPYLRQIESSTLHGQAAARAMLKLKQSYPKSSRFSQTLREIFVQAFGVTTRMDLRVSVRQGYGGLNAWLSTKGDSGFRGVSPQSFYATYFL